MRYWVHYWRKSEGCPAPGDKGTGASGLLGKNDTRPRRFYARRESSFRFAVRDVSTVEKNVTLPLSKRKVFVTDARGTDIAPRRAPILFCLQQSSLFRRFSSRPRREIDDKGFLETKTRARTCTSVNVDRHVNVQLVNRAYFWNEITWTK